MLPSTGYFKGINCPFYDSGLCERPYCHFRHVKKDSFSTLNDGVENGDTFQKLVSKVVRKVLQHSESSDVSSLTNTITDATKDHLQNASILSAKATYNPTPICKLNKIQNNSDTENTEEQNEQRKRHIPVPYTPRKPASIPIKRPIDSDDFKPFIYNPPPIKYTPGSADSTQLDLYTPKGAVESKEKYLPGTEAEIQEYAPKETQTNAKRSYIPSDKSVNKKKLLEYKPTKVTQKTEIPLVTYRPTPCSLVPCFSSDEEEPEVKKPRLSNDLNGLDDLGEEFDILDQIFDEEKLEQDIVKRKLRTSQSLANTSIPSKIEKMSKEKKTSKNKTPKEKEMDTKDTPSESKVKKSESSQKKSDHKSSSSKERDKDKKTDKDKNTKDKSKDRDKERKRERDKNKKDRDKEKNKEKDNNKVKLVNKERDRDKHKSKDKEKDKSSNKKSSSKSSHKSSRQSDSSSKHSSHSDKSKHKDKHDKHKKPKEKDKHSRNSKENESNGHSTSDHESNSHMDNFGLEQENHDEEIYEISESDEESIALECKRIFEEYVPTEKPVTTEVVFKPEENNENEYLSAKKRVSRAVDKNIKIIPKAQMKPDYKVSAAQAMAERLAKVREYHAQKKAESKKHEESTLERPKIVPSTPTGGSKIRIAHVPYASTLMNAKRTISTTPKVVSVKLDPSTSSTITQTVKKGEKRVAHVPNDKFIDRPGVLEPLASKIPANIRTTYLNMMIDESLKIYLHVADAYNRAQHEELNTSKKCSTVQIYKNSAVLTVSRLRKELQECKGVKKSGVDCHVLQRIPQGISGSSGNASSWSIQTKNRKSYENIQEYRGAKLYNNIQKWILTEEQLQENGFPRTHTSGEKGRAIIYNQRKQKPPIGNIRTCCRCRKEYTVNKKSFPTVKEECIYHPNNKYRVRGEAKYQCCSQDATSDGCCVAPTHVYEYVDYENLRGYVKTMPPEREMDDYGVYSLDCEMCYTTHGLDLTRVTVINADCKVVYETLIKPLHPIIDYNTRYSGITEEQMADVRTTLLEVQATLLTMFNSKTILIGHSLESDFKALKLIHDTVIDTSVLFPHKMGPPYKRALRNLCSEHLKKIIQNSVEGHDSAEDAMVCMELIHYKLKEHLKTR